MTVDDAIARIHSINGIQPAVYFADPIRRAMFEVIWELTRQEPPVVGGIAHCLREKEKP